MRCRIYACFYCNLTGKFLDREPPPALKVGWFLLKLNVLFVLKKELQHGRHYRYSATHCFASRLPPFSKVYISCFSEEPIKAPATSVSGLVCLVTAFFSSFKIAPISCPPPLPPLSSLSLPWLTPFSHALVVRPVTQYGTHVRSMQFTSSLSCGSNAFGSLSANATASAEMLENGITWKYGNSWGKHTHTRCGVGGGGEGRG